MPRRLHLWIVLGGKSSRKGSTIRALTGAGRARILDVMTTNGHQMPIWCKIASVNEAWPPPPPRKWVQSLFKIGADNFLVAFQLDHGVAGREATDYLDALAASNATIEQIVTLGEPTRGWVKNYTSHHAHVSNSDIATNAIAHQIRKLWGWR